MQEKDSLIKIKLTDAWPDVVALEVGRIGIAFAQLQREVYLAAKRKAGLPLPQWETKHRNDNFKREGRAADSVPGNLPCNPRRSC